MKIAFDAQVLASITSELQELVGGKVQRISQPEELQIVLSIFNGGVGEKHFLIDVSPRFFRAHLTTRKSANAPTPSPFCATLRKYLMGARVLSIKQREGDRILDLKLGRAGDEYLLSAELMGRHSNIILASADGKVLHAAKLITSRQNRVRETLPGREYIPPPAPPTRSVSAVVASSPKSSAELEEYFSSQVPRAQLHDEKKAFLGMLQKQLKQKQVALSQVERGANESTRAVQYRRWGELVLGNLQAVKAQLESGASEVEVLDFYSEDNATIRIPLDAEQSASQNAERLFARARHVEENAAELMQLQGKLRQEVAEIERFIARIDAVESGPDDSRDALEYLKQLRTQAIASGWLRTGLENATSHSKAGVVSSFDGHKIRRYVSPDGYEVFVGENATANDYLVTRLSHSNDWWLHLRAGTSSHAIVRTQNAPDRVPKSTLQFAARLVAARSVAKHAAVCDVDYTLRKYVRKPRKAAPGLVTYSHEKTLRVNND